MKKNDIQEKLKEYQLELRKKVSEDKFQIPVQTNGSSLIHNTVMSKEPV